uniref:Pre-mRNA splicing Prp18-interacting factor n=1 Tax=Tanacetum cinerariifolium TaxID=118510 RepID=A0A699J1L4_TANCI|nr:hypothetical protein [Tanacetum cinerariifolium]
MTSFDYRLNPRFTIKECSSCGALYTRDCSCSKGSVEDKVLVPKPPKNCARCAKCGHPVNGPYCQGCALLREKLEEDLVSYFQNFQNIFESSDDSTNVVNAPREPVVVKKDHGVKSSQNPPHIDKCCCECGNALNGIYCQQCICPHENFQCQPVNYCEPNPSYDSYYSGFDQFGDSHPQQYLCCENRKGPHKTFQCQPTNEDYYHEQNSCYNSNSFGSDQYTVNHPIFNAHNDFLNSQNELSTSQNTIIEQMTQLTSMCEMVCQIFQKKQEEKRIEEEQAANARYRKIPACYDDDEDYDDVDYTIAITPVLSTEETENSDLIPIPSESEGIPDIMCDVHFVNNPTPLKAKDHVEIVVDSKDDISSSDDDSLYNENIEYVVASPHDSKLVSLEAAEIVISEDEEIEDDNLREKLLNIHLLIANIKALKDNPTQSSKFLTKSSSKSLKSFLEETNTSHNSLPEFENFYFDLGEISSGSTTTHSDISLPDYEAFSFDDDHIKEISSGSTTTHSDISLSEYHSFVFDPSNDQFPPTDRSDFANKEFADELVHFISPPEYDCFYFRNLPDSGELISIFNSIIRENPPSTTRVNSPVEDDYSPLLAYVVWIFLSYLTNPVIPPYLHPFENEDTIFDPGITVNRIYSFKTGLSHRCRAFKKFNTHRSHLNKWPMIINGKNIPILDVLLFHFYPP